MKWSNSFTTSECKSGNVPIRLAVSVVTLVHHLIYESLSLCASLHLSEEEVFVTLNHERLDRLRQSHLDRDHFDKLVDRPEDEHCRHIRSDVDVTVNIG